MTTVKVYDNEGFSLDRYTVIIDDQHCYGMCHAPLMPTGINMYIGDLHCDVIEGEHLGKLLEFIPSSIQEAIDQRKQLLQ